MKSESLYGLDRPDELKDLNLKDAKPSEVIKTTFKAWADLARKEKYDPRIEAEYHERIYKIACHLIRPFKEKIIGTLHLNTDELGHERVPYATEGLFLSAVINETDAEKFLFEEDIYQHNVGYRLKSGKTLEIGKRGVKKKWSSWAGMGEFGKYAEGGTIINNCHFNSIGPHASDLKLRNYGKLHSAGINVKDGELVNYGEIGGVMGNGSSGGIWLNKGKTRMFGSYVKGGIWVNQEKVGQSMGSEAAGGIWFNFGNVLHMGRSATDGIFVAKRKPKKGFMNASKAPALGVGPEELESDNKLSLLVDYVDEASDEERFDDIREFARKVKKMARKIEERVRKYYKPRKVA